MSYKEIFIFSPNLNNWNNVLIDLSNLLSKFQIQKKTLFIFYNNLKKEELLIHQKNLPLLSWLQNSYGIDLNNLSNTKLSSNLEFSQDTKLMIDESNRIISWTHLDPVKHNDMLSILAYIENYRIWVKSYALYTIKIKLVYWLTVDFGVK